MTEPAIDLSGFTEPFSAFCASQPLTGTQPARKVQTTRYLKTSCTCCGWTARVTRKHLGIEAGGVQATFRCPVMRCPGELVQVA